jgi:hypothetical protein
MSPTLRSWQSDSDGDRHTIAERTVNTLVTVYGLSSEQDIDIQSGWD